MAAKIARVSAIEPVFINSESTPGFLSQPYQKKQPTRRFVRGSKVNGREKNNYAPHVNVFALRLPPLQRPCREIARVNCGLRKCPARYGICRTWVALCRSYQQGGAFMQISEIDRAMPFFDKSLSQ